ncbi:hypothetical protein [Leptolyngbya sp. CCNP1308]|uniref:hypothetical protein n=1 Tax=Leptolyngbya sp. CCNP1308 TaxID=3110255 RepID=UPI002B1EA432|nr:hypothetical protein [Leptolyngbya sp. CCNP1308]
MDRTPSQAPNQAPERVPGQNPESYPNQTPGRQQPRSQDSGQMQTPGMDRTPSQAPNQAPERVPGQNPESYPNQTPGRQQPRSQDSGQMQTPGQTSMPSTELNSMGMGESLSTDLVSPFQLAYMAVRGELNQGGGEGYSAHKARQGNAEGQNIVEAAINQGYISSALMEDQGYIDSVNQVLRMRASDWRG